MTQIDRLRPAGRRVGTVLTLALALTAAATLSATAAASRHLKGVLTGGIRFVGDAVPRTWTPRAGDVSVFTPAGKFVARKHERAGHYFRIRLAPGHYLVTPSRRLHSNFGPGAASCPTVKVVVHAGRTTHVDVDIGCGLV